MQQTDTAGSSRKSDPLRIILTRGERASSFTIRPMAAGLLAGTCLLVIAGYLGAAGYLMLRDDLKTDTAIEQIRQARDYEDRIAELRARIDRITSRSLVAQQTYEKQIETLKERQGEIDARHTRVADVLARAAENGLTIAESEPIPLAKPARTPAILPDGPLPESTESVGGTNVPLDKSVSLLGLRGSMIASSSKSDRVAAAETAYRQDGAKTMVMSRIENALEVMDRQSQVALDLIAVAAERRIARIEHVTRSLGVAIDGDDDAVGGPFEPYVGGNFDDRLVRAEKAITRLSALRNGARSLPLGLPLDTISVSSTYGPRMDPFLATPAMHTGTDLRAEYGTPIHATAAGKVVSAGRNGGYGLMVEIDHGNGVVTRYGHMARILVSEGDEVNAGEVVGQVGSTGRSTGAHLHYETRLASGPVDPQMFLDAGEKLAGILN